MLLLLLLCSHTVQPVAGVILTGAPDSFARYPKWSMSYENELSFELRTRQSDALLLYVDDGGVNANFLCLSLVDGRLQLELRTGETSQELPLLTRVLTGGPGAEKRALLQTRVDQVRLDDGRWHKFSLFQAWENVKLTVDEEVQISMLNQASFHFGALKTNSDVFVGGIPKVCGAGGRLHTSVGRHQEMGVMIGPGGAAPGDWNTGPLTCGHEGMRAGAIKFLSNVHQPCPHYSD